MTRYKLFAIIVVVAMLLAACGTPAAEPPEQPAATDAPAVQAPATEAPAAAEAKPIVVAVWSGPEHDNLVKVAEEYTKATGKKVIVEEVAREAYFDKLNTITANCGKDYDAFYAMSDFVPAYVAAEGLKDLNTFFEDPKVVSPDFSLKDYGMATSFFTFNGKTYVLPSEETLPGCGIARTFWKRRESNLPKPGMSSTLRRRS
jgi:ABC-type glycerol-3-phosphate transport system substrate-binding protein